MGDIITSTDSLDSKRLAGKSLFVMYDGMLPTITITSGAGSGPGTSPSTAVIRPGNQTPTGTTSTGASSLVIVGTANLAATGGTFRLDRFSTIEVGATFQLPLLSDVSETFRIFAGVTARTAATSVFTNGFFFRVTGTLLEAVSHDGTTETAVSWGTAIAADGVYRLRARRTSTDIQFFVNDALIATITTNLPSVSAAMHCEAAIMKTVGTTSRVAYWGNLGMMANYV